MIKLVFEGNPVSINKTYKTTKKSRMMYLSQEAKDFSELVRWQAKIQFKGQEMLHKNLEVIYHYYFNDNRVRDHLNYNKLLNDCLNQIVWKDDKQIKASRHFSLYDNENPRIEMYIAEIPNVWHVKQSANKSIVELGLREEYYNKEYEQRKNNPTVDDRTKDNGDGIIKSRSRNARKKKHPSTPKAN